MRRSLTSVMVLVAGLSCSKDNTGPNPVPPTITVIPDSATVDLFDTLRLRAVVVSSNGDTLTDVAGWTSASPNVVFVSSTGRVEGLNRGTVTISATADGATGTTRIKVKINVISVQLTPQNSPLNVGDTLRLRAALFTADGLTPDDSTVAWRSSDTAKASVSPSGLVTARAQGSVTISAQVDSAVGHATFSIPEPVTKIILSTHLDTLRQDSLVNITATPIGTASDTLLAYPVTWTSSDTSIAKLSVDPFDANIGAYKPGRAVIRAQIGTAFDSCVVIVVRPSVATIAVSPDTGHRILPGAFAVHATIKDSTGLLLTNRTITWTLSDTSLADIGPNTGTNVVVTGKNPGTLQVRATSEGKVDSATFQFLHPSVSFESIVPDTGSFIIPTQSYFGLTAIVRDSAGDTLTDRVTTWSVVDTTVAVPSPVTGPSTNIVGRKAGLAVVIATTESHVDTARILVIRPTVNRIVLSPDTSSIVVPATVNIGGVVEDSAGQQLFGRPIHWASADTAIATVSDTNGDYIAVSGKLGGTARIVASAEGVSDTAIVHVIRPSVAQVVLLPRVDTTHLLLGTSRTLGAEAQDSNGTPLSRPVNFASSDSAVVHPTPLVQVGAQTFETVAGAGIGTAVITASSEGKSVTWNASVYSVGYDTVAAGNSESCMPATDGLVYCWNPTRQPFPTPVAATTGIHTLSAKLDFACGIDAGGNAYCWGQSAAALGVSGGLSNDTARAVTGGTVFSRIDVGWEYVCGVTSGGGLACWGNNDRAQLGLGDSVSRTTPTALTVSTTFGSVSVGYQHSCAIASAGTLYCWGANGSGQAGQPSGADVEMPKVVDSALVFSVVSSGYDHTCALTTAGVAYCWGDNAFGQLGTGDQANRSAPAPVVGGLTFKSIATGIFSTCAVTTGGAAYCWGYGGYYALGTGTQTSSLTPIAVSGGLTFTSISSGIGGNGTVCGMATSGAYCWGIGAAGGVATTPSKVPGQP